MVDPFSADAPGHKLPDSYAGHSVPFTSNLTFEVTTPPNSNTDPNMATVTAKRGSSLFLLSPDPSLPIVTGVVGNKASGVWANTNDIFYWPNSINFTGVAGDANAFAGTAGNGKDITSKDLQNIRRDMIAARLVGGGAQFATGLSNAAVSGFVHVAPVFVSMATYASVQGVPGQGNDVMLASWQTSLPESLDAMEELDGYQSYPLSAFMQGEATCVFKQYADEAKEFKPVHSPWLLDQVTSANYLQRRGAQNTPSGIGHYCILVYISGVMKPDGTAPPESYPIGEVQWRCHYEGQPNPVSSLAASVYRGSTTLVTGSQAAGYAPLVDAALSNFSRNLPAIRVTEVTDSEDTLWTHLSSLWDTAVSVATGLQSAVGTASTIAALLL